MRPKLMLVTPPYHSGVVEAAGVWMPLHFAYLAGAARGAGAEVLIYDAMSLGDSHEDVARQIEAFAPDLVGVTAITAMEPDARVICQTVKRLRPQARTVLGNVHPTYQWREILTGDPNVDLVVIGEGEQTLADLVRAVVAGDALTKVAGLALRVDGEPRLTAERGFLADLDVLQPAWDLIDWPRYFYRPQPDGRLAIVSSSRGCSQKCLFCSQQRFWKQTWRGRRPEAFVAELEGLRDRFGVRVAMLADETPTMDQARWEQLLDLLIARRTGVELLMETRVDHILRDEGFLHKYPAAGVSHIYVGVEATSQGMLDRFQKDIKVEQSKKAIDLINQHGMVSETSFVLGMPDETPASIQESLALAKHYDPDLAFFLAIVPWPYAEIYESLAPHIEVFDYRRYNLVEPVVKPRAMTLAQLGRELGRASQDFYMSKLRRLEQLSPHKRQFLLKVMKIMTDHSYLGDQMRAAGAEMPPEVKKLLAGR